MSFGVIPNFDALTIAQSQAQKYHLQNILYYHNSRLRNYGVSEAGGALDVEELGRIINEMIKYEGDDIEFPCLSQEKIADHISNVVESFFGKLHDDPEIFADNITVNAATKRGIEEIGWNAKNKIRELVLEDQMLVLKMDVYIALPYNESVLSDDSSSFHSSFLKDFQEEWGISRPWRYVSVRNWIYVPRITVYGDEVYGLEPVGEYIQGLTSQIHEGLGSKLSYDLIRKFYAYMKLVKYFSEKDIDPRRFCDQILFYHIRESCNKTDFEELRCLETFFEESSTSFVYSLLCDLRVCEHIKEVYPRIDPDFVQQSLQTIEYLLKEHHISCDIEVLEKYIESRLNEEMVITSSEIEKLC